MPGPLATGAGAAGHDPFGIIVLAGGRGTRLGGRDKPGLVVGGRTLIGAVVAAGTAAGAREVIVVGPERTGLAGVSFVTEEPPGAGPVPALRRGLAEVTVPWVALLAADLPFLRPDDLGTLRRAAAGYDGTSLGGLLGPLGAVMVRLAPVPGAPPPWLDCDTPEDLDRARAWVP